MSEIYGEAKRPHVCVNYGRHHCVHSGFVPNLFVYWFLHLILGLHRGFFSLYVSQSLREVHGK